MNLTNMTFTHSYIGNTQIVQNVIHTTCKVGWDLIIFGFIGLYILSAVFHELGHWLVLTIKRPFAEIRFYRTGTIRLRLVCGTEADYQDLPTDFKIQLYAFGILTGFIPIAIAGAFHPVFYLMIAPYVTNCHSDIMKIWRLLKR